MRRLQRSYSRCSRSASIFSCRKRPRIGAMYGLKMRGISSPPNNREDGTPSPIPSVGTPGSHTPTIRFCHQSIQDIPICLSSRFSVPLSACLSVVTHFVKLSVSPTLWHKNNQGKVQAIDRRSDLALLKCEVPSDRLPLPVAEIGQSLHLRAGEFVVAMGSPGGLANTCTLGIVSATARARSDLGEVSVRVGNVVCGGL